MRTLYIQQIEHKQTPEAIDVITEEVTEAKESTPHWAGMKALFKAVGATKSKEQEKIRKRVKKAWKAGDARVMKKEGKYRVDMHSNYMELLK